jgi:hypothetical protein
MEYVWENIKLYQTNQLSYEMDISRSNRNAYPIGVFDFDVGCQRDFTSVNPNRNESIHYGILLPVHFFKPVIKPVVRQTIK